MSGAASAEAAQAMQAFEAAVDDDLHTPRALAGLFDLVNVGHQMLEAGTPTGRLKAGGIFAVLLECGAVLGLFRHGITDESPETRERIQALIAQRDQARQAKDFARADEIRERLRQEGFLLTDTASGTLWRSTR